MENQKLGQEPAFPIEENYTGNYGPVTNTYFGISKRFYTACAAMQGILSNSSMMISFSQMYSNEKDASKKILKHLIAEAYIYADKLLEQENK